MKAPFLALVAVAVMAASPAAAECYADYKAKMIDPPLRLHYGVAEVPDASCDTSSASSELEPRLADAGFTLLVIVSTFGPEGLDERKASAGDNFLRY